jgi:hypothetical protein
MAKAKETPAEPVPFTPPAGGGRYQLIDGEPVPVIETEQAVTEPNGEKA